MSEPVSSSRPIWKRILLSPDEPRLRAGWRLLIQTLWLILIGLGISLPIRLLGLDIPWPKIALVFEQAIALLVVTLSVFLARRLLDRRSIVSLGLSRSRYTLMDILAGISITFVVFLFIFAIMSIAGWVEFHGFAWQETTTTQIIKELLLIFFVFVLVGWNEELLSRGYHLQTLASGLNLTWGVIISSAVFGALHLGNPNATWASVAGIFFAGVFLAYAYIRTKQLWLPIGLHIGWNFFEGPIFGFPVSGLDTFRLTHITVSGPELWTGGAFGPEAGLIVLPGLALGAILIYLYTRIVTNRAT